MGIFDWLYTNSKKVEETVPAEEVLSAKELATKNKQPYVCVLDTHIDPNDPANGYFEIDWNVYFIDDLRKAGYSGNTDQEVLDQWFKALCQNILAEENINKVVRIT